MSTISTDTSASADKSAQPASISLQDIQNLLLVLDTAAQRGAFKGAELSQIGQLFDRVSLFLQTAIPSQPAQQEKTPDPVQMVPPPVMPSQPAMAPVTSPMMPPFAPKIGA